MKLRKAKKYYFFDNGIRNVLISNFTIPEMRMDTGALWENFLLGERLKRNAYLNEFSNAYFWRTHDQAEIDYIEEKEGILNAYEIKWKKDKNKFPNSFLTAYPQHTTELINNSNFEDFISF